MLVAVSSGQKPSANAAKLEKVTWQGSLIFPSIEWIVKIPPGVSGKHTAKVVVIQPDGKEYEYAIYGEKSDWKMKFFDSNGQPSFGIPERAAYLNYSPLLLV